MLKKFTITLLVILFLLAALSGAAWYGINYFFVPKVLLPNVLKEIEKNNRSSAVKLLIKDIDYNPYHGFTIKKIEVFNSRETTGPFIFKAETVDIDLAWLSLLQRHIEISNFKVYQPRLNITREKKENWNFAPLAKAPLKGKRFKDFKFSINEIDFLDGTLTLTDNLVKPGPFKKNFAKINLIIKARDDHQYEIHLSGGAEEPKKETVFLEAKVSIRQKTAWGKIKFNTVYFNDYSKHYFKSALLPWALSAGETSSSFSFSYQKEILVLSGEATILLSVLNYGDIQLKSNAKLKFGQRFAKGKRIKEKSRVEGEMKNLTILTGKEPVLSNGYCSASINHLGVNFHKVSGYYNKHPLDLKGKFIFGSPRQLFLNGKIGIASHVFSMKIFPENRAIADWKAATEASSLKLGLSLSNLKKLVFSGNISSEVDLSDLQKLTTFRLLFNLPGISLEVTQKDLAGRLLASGKLAGDFDDEDTWKGRINLGFHNFSVLKSGPRSFNLALLANNGLFSADIPAMPLYEGAFSSRFQMNSEKWGMALQLKGLNLAHFGAADPRLKKLKGALNVNFSCVSPWSNPSSMEGGGYLNLSNASLTDSPISKIIEEAITKINHGFKMPDFNSIEGNFSLKDQQWTLEGARCLAPHMEIDIKGAYTFSGETNFTVGTSFIQAGPLTPLRLVLLPFTLGFDAAANALRINITGTWPDLKQTNSIQPLHWVSNYFGPQPKFDPDKYTLNKIWD